MSSKSFLLRMGSVVVAIVAVSAIIGGTAVAKPEFSQKTGQACGACHVNASGGGKLTAAGEKYKKTLK